MQSTVEKIKSDLEEAKPACPSIRALAAKYAKETRLSEGSILLAYYRSQKVPLKKHGNQLLTDVEEKALLSLVLTDIHAGEAVGSKKVLGSNSI